MNIEKIIFDLNNRFSNAIRQYGNDNKKGTDRYKHEVNFAYIMNDITRSPGYIIPKHISNANLYINSLDKIGK